MKTTLFPFILLLSFLAGSSLSLLLDASRIDYSFPQQLALAAFIFVISYDVGSKITESDTRSMLRQTLALVASCIIGSAFAGMLFSFFAHYSMRLSLAISLGMGWYTFDGPAIAGYAGAIAGALGFFSNFLRELLTLVFYLPISKVAGRIKPITLGGATTMDTTLTVMRSNKEPAVTAIAFTHGALLSLFVPILVSLLLL